LDNIGNIDSKYRFIIVASKRAKQLLKGAKPKLKAKSRNLIRIAQSEVKAGLVEYEVIPAGKEEIPEPEERVFVGADIGVEEAAEPDVPAGKEPAEDETGKPAEEESEEGTEESEDENEDLEGEQKEDKDE